MSKEFKNSELRIKIGEKLKQIRIKQGLSLNDISKKTKLSTDTIRKIEKGISNSRFISLSIILIALNITFTDILK